MPLNKVKSLAKETLKAHSKSLFPARSPFEVHVNPGVDASKTKPYFIETFISFGDPIFKKRLSAVLKEEKYLLVYEFKEENEGSIFKPMYKTNLQMYMTKQVITTSDAFILETLTLGLVQTHLTKDGVIKMNSFKKRKDYFKSEVESELYAEKILITLKEFLNNQYEEYKKI